MDLRPGRRFFLDPELTFHRRYEALRAFFVEARPLAFSDEDKGSGAESLNRFLVPYRFHRHGRTNPKPIVQNHRRRNEESCIRRAAARNGFPQADFGPSDTISLN